MKKAPTYDQASGALDTQQQPVTGNDCRAQSTTTASPFYGPSNPRQARVLDALIARRRMSQNAVREIGGALNGPHVIAELRAQGLSKLTDLCTEWVKCIDRDGQKVRYGIYVLTDAGLEKVRAWQASEDGSEAA